MALALCLAVVLCAATTVTARKAGTSAALTFWSIFPQGDPKLAAMEQVIAEFEDRNPGIKIDHLGTNFWDYFGKLSTAQAAGEDPDVAFNNLNDVYLRAKSGVVQSLTPRLQGMDLTQFNQNDLDFFTYDEEIYALPFSSDYRLLYYNKDHFAAAGLDPEKPPATVEELIEYAAALDVWQGNATLQRVGFHPKLGNHDFWADVWNIGGEFFTEDGTPDLENEKVIAGLRRYVELCNRYPTRAFNSFYTRTLAGEVDSFTYQHASMEVCGDWLAWEIRESVRKGETEGFNWDVAPYPYEDGNRAAYGVGFSVEMSSHTEGEKADAAFKFMQYLTSYEVQARWVELFKFTPVNMHVLQDMINDPDTPQNVRNIFAEAPYKRPPDIFEARPQWYDTVKSELANALSGDKTVEQAMASANLALKDALAVFKEENPASPVDVFIPIVFGALVLAVIALYVFVRKKGAG
jgi:multiple sugar transport system substrate-binding protein